MRLPTPAELKAEFPSPAFRREGASLLMRKDQRLVVLVGPCSIHDPVAAVEYAERLRKLSREVEKSLFLIMRVFFEKPRTGHGWKGLLYDPYLDHSSEIGAGLCLSRKLLLQINALGIPCAAELLEPLVLPYFDDLLTWGVIGARTAASQPHRQMASGLAFPVGFKNDIHGELDVAISGILSSRLPHTHIGIDNEGKICRVETRGNPLTHLILRGSETETNFDPSSVAKAICSLKKHHLEPRLFIDCSHGNSKKDHRNQHSAFLSSIEQICDGNDAIAGVMLESNLYAGKQPLGEDPSFLHYGISVTDSCIGWEETESLLLWAAERLSCRSMSINSVQK